MAAEKEVSLIIRARDRTRGVLRRIGRGVGRIASNAARVASLLGAGLVAGAAALGRSATSINDAAKLLGISAEEFQAAERIFARTGIDRQGTVDILRDLSVRAQEAKDDAGDARDAFAKLLFTRADLDKGPLGILQAVQDGARAAGLSVQDLNQVLDQIGGDQLTELSTALRSGGRITSEVRQIADSDEVRSNEQVAQTAAAMRETQEQLNITMSRLATIMESELPRLVTALERSIDAYEGATSAEGAIPGGLGATVAGTFELAVRNLQDNLDTFINSNSRGVIDIETKEAILETAKNSRDNEARIN